MNKIIWTYWHQGFDQAPSGIFLCIDQWKKLHTDWEIKLLDQYNIYEYAEPLPIKASTLDKMMLPHQSDLLRTQLLIKYGGVWADPTTFPHIPLEDWLFDYMQASYFLFYKPSRDRIIADWFIATEPRNIMIKSLYSVLVDYWNKYDSNNISNAKADLT